MKYFAPTRISENIHKTPEGYLLCIGVAIGRTGEMEYAKGETPLEVGSNGTVMVTRDADELFKPEVMASFQGKSVTIKHPEEFVDPKTWNELTVGILQNVRRGKGEQSEDLIADLLITSEEAIAAVEGGMREVSCGYECGYIQTGEGAGRQVEIIGNHLALVDQGRAGPSYAINDHKGQENGKGPKLMKKKKLMDEFKALFAKTQDAAAKAIDEAMEEESKDEAPEEKKEESKDAKGYDELVSMVKDLSGKMKDFLDINNGKSKDAEEPKKEEAKEEEKKEESKDESEEATAGIEARLEKLEAMMAKIMEGESEEAEGESFDEESEEGEESEDDAEEETVLTGDTGDTAMRAEILAPGIAITKDVKAKALKTAYATKEGKMIIDALSGGKVPTFDSAEKVDALFVSASEVLKAARSSELSHTKKTRDSAFGEVSQGAMTPERMNEINAKRYGTK